MRYRLMAIYKGVPYHVGLGPDGTDATLFSPAPPPDELGFTAVGGHWRKQVSITDLSALWRSRLVGEYRGEPCLVLDDLGDRLHIAYLGRDSVRARQLGYWEIDRGVFEVVVARQEVTGLTEERAEFPPTSAMFPSSHGEATAHARPRAPGREAPTGAGRFPQASREPHAPDGPPQAARGPQAPDGPPQAPDGPPQAPGGLQPAAGFPQGADGPPRAAGRPTGPLRAGSRPGLPEQPPRTPDRVAAWHGSPDAEPWAEPGPESRAEAGSQPQPEPARPWAAPSARSQAEPGRGPWAAPGAQARPGPGPGPWAQVGARTQAEPDPRPWAGPEAVSPSGRRAGRRDRIPQSPFAELLSLAAIPHTAYAIDGEVPGAMCLVKADGGFEVFTRTDDARLDVRFFEDEEAAYFYLFGVLAAEAVRSGRLRPGGANGSANGPRGQEVPSAAGGNVSKLLRARKLAKPGSGPAMVN